MTATTDTPSSTPPTPSGRSPRRTAPGLGGLALGRQLMRIRDNPLAALDRSAAQYGDVFRLSGGPGMAHSFFVAAPEAIRQVLITDQDNYTKSSQYEILQRVLGFGLVTSEGELWRERRSITQPHFAKRALAPFAEHMAAAATAALTRWDAAWDDGAEVDLSLEMSTVTLDIVGRALVGTDFSARSREFGDALGEMLEAAGAVGRSPVTQIAGAISSIGVGRSMRAQPRRMRRMNAAIDVLDDVVLEIIRRRQRENVDHDDLLGVLMGYRNADTGEALSDVALRDELMTFVTAGHETTANALSWMWMLLSRHPEAREQLLAEVDEVLGGRVPTAADLDALPWTTACFQEAMRLYPPVWIVQRRAIADTTIGDYHVPAGSIVSVAPWLMHRSAQYWPNPEAYDPRRFLPGADADRPRLAYMPFAAGRRVCIGQGFAMMEGVLLAAMLSQRYTFDLVRGAQIDLEPTITLRPRHGIHVTAHRRT